MNNLVDKFVIGLALIFWALIGVLVYNEMNSSIYEAFFISLALSFIIGGALIYTKKWLTVGLNEVEYNGAVGILAFIFYGTLLTVTIRLFVSYEDKINSFVFYLILFLIVFSILLPSFSFLTIRLNFFGSEKNEIIKIITTLLISIGLTYFFGEYIISWFKDNWYYFVGGLVLIGMISGIISIVIKNRNKQDN